MGTKLGNAPVFYTVIQVQFNPILNLDSFIPTIQSKMREAKFPDYMQEMFQRLVFPFGGSDAAQAPAPGLSPQSRYKFGDMDGRTSFLLETNTLTLQSTAYETFEDFLSIFLSGLMIVNNSLNLAFVERIGLRYLDAIYPMKEGDRFNAYLVPEVQGLSGKIAGDLVHSVSETIAHTSVGQLVSRVIIRNGRIGFPENLAIQPPQLAARFTQYEGIHAILDTDAFQMRREAFNIDEIQSRLVGLHEYIRESFNMTVTKHALAAWA